MRISVREERVCKRSCGKNKIWSLCFFQTHPHPFPAPLFSPSFLYIMNTVQLSAEHFMKLSATDILLAVLAILVIHRLFSHLLKPSGLQSPPKIVVPLIGSKYMHLFIC